MAAANSRVPFVAALFGSARSCCRGRLCKVLIVMQVGVAGVREADFCLCGDL